MEITASAHNHGVSDADILHAWRNATYVGVYEYDGEERLLAIGGSTGGALLEPVAVPSETPTRIIHADQLRPAFYDLLTRWQTR